jgi:type IV fimbrial biogenesis protein FimT
MINYVANAVTAPQRRSARGFSLIELMMVLTVGGILLAIAVPSFRSFMQNSRLTTQANTLVYALNLARSSAIRLDTTVEVCASSDGATCNSANWQNGWIVCYPAASCAVGGGPPAPTVLGSYPQLGSGNTATEQVVAAAAVPYLSNGQTNNGVGGTTYRFVFCDNRGAAFGQDVEINFTGRIQASSTPGQLVSGAALGGC